MLLDQVDGFRRAKDEMGETGRDLTLSLSRLAYVTRNEADRRAKVDAAQHYYGRFDNVFTGPGIVENGMVRELPRAQSAEDLAASLLIGSPQEMVDKLMPYQELGIDRVILNVNFGCNAQETIEAIHCFAEEVMPFFTGRTTIAAAE
ncbi:MAG: LLM class flavin-dependent oxidoreductase, partial [Pseudomonadota bacterium]